MRTNSDAKKERKTIGNADKWILSRKKVNNDGEIDYSKNYQLDYPQPTVWKKLISI